MMRRLFHTSWISLAAPAAAGGRGNLLLWLDDQRPAAAGVGGDRRLGPVTLTISGARGTLHSGLHVDKVVVDHQRVRVTSRPCVSMAAPRSCRCCGRRYG